MKWLVRNWGAVGGVVALVVVGILLCGWNSFEVLVRLQLLSFVAMLVHQFEEYTWPGGEPAITNILLHKSDVPDRYPLNALTACLGNMALTYIIYLLPVFLPHVIWLGLIPMYMGFAQFIVHGIVTNIKLHTWYNPGLGAVVLLHYPVGIYYCWYVASQGIATTAEWWFGVLGLVVGMACFIAIPIYKVFPRRDSRWPFTRKEMEKFHVQEKLARLNK